MHKAFQYMPDNVKTKYFIQLDADMILKENSILRLYNEIQKSNFLTYRISGQLYEKGFGVGGHVKCWKKNVFKYFKFKDVRTVDRNFHNRVKLFGFRNKVIKDIFGYHVPRHSTFSSYLKTKSDIEKWRFLKRPYEKYAKNLLNEIINSKETIRLNGFLFGSVTLTKYLLKSKNINYEKKLFNEISKKYDFISEKFNISKLKNHSEIINLIANNYENFRKDDLNLKITLLDKYFKLFDIPHYKIVKIIKLINE